MTRQLKSKFPSPAPAARYGRLVVVSKVPDGWWCKCDCGIEKRIRTSALRQGTARSCGCLRTETHGACAEHGMRDSSTYHSWASMHQRCNNPNHPRYADYGGRGITICERWSVFQNFLADMGEAPADTSIDRFPDNDGNYEPGNCRWATDVEQTRNRRVTLTLEFNGATKPLAQWCEELGVLYSTASYRLRNGRPAEEVLSREPLPIDQRERDQAGKFVACEAVS